MGVVVPRSRVLRTCGLGIAEWWNWSGSLSRTCGRGIADSWSSGVIRCCGVVELASGGLADSWSLETPAIADSWSCYRGLVEPYPAPLADLWNLAGADIADSWNCYRGPVEQERKVAFWRHSTHGP